MNQKVIIGLLSLVIAFGLGAYLMQPAQPVQGSVSYASEYHSTSTRTLPASTAIAALSLLGSGPSTLGSVVVTGAGAGNINFYDATTSNALLRAGTMATSNITVASIPASAAAGTYTFDVVVYNGLLMEVTGTAPTSTVTYR